ncbi:MAG: threonylcarbamoyl-AMP synthase [Oscillospiraceae bacterium]|nr:threonylcarbamoyl-AMP synthase [Oscillospiraceae bacterium]
MNTELLDASRLDRAAEILRVGGLVAIPTETVYGLGANGLNESAVARIFEVKGRPQDNPLILHVAAAEDLEKWCRDIPAAAWALTERFWPGPLTLVLYRQEAVPLRVTAGLETVAMRNPDHPLTREVLRLAGVPVAAPSANLSGKPSTTTAEHCVHDLWGKVEAILDGGPCRVGVESTILDLSVTPPRVLRPGGITLEQLRSVLPETELDPGLVKAGETPKAPGMKYRHYSPQAEVRLLQGDKKRIMDYVNSLPDAGTAVLCFRGEEGLFPGKCTLAYGREEAPETLAAGLFDSLRTLDTPEVKLICARCPSEEGVGWAVVNRLKKAAGGKITCL